MPSNRTDSPTTTRPAWIGYAVTIVVEALLTLVLVLIEPHFPLGQFPIAYVVMIMLVAYLFGEGPAVLSLVLGFLSFVYFFVQPRYTFSPPADSPQGWASLVAYLIGAAIVGFATIIVRRAKRRVERLLNEVSRSNQRVTDILESITDAFFALDHEWRFIYVNAEAERVLRNPRELLLGRNMWEAYPDAVGSVFDDEYHRAVSQHAAVGFEAFYPPFDAWFEVRAYPSAEGLSVYFHDITERKKAEQTLRRYQLLSEDARHIVLFIRLDGTIIEANDSAVKAYGYTHDKLLALSIYDLRSPETAPSVAEQMEKANSTGIVYETVHRRKDGSTFPVEVSSQGADVDGQRVLMNVVRDVSERVRLRHALETQVSQLQRALLSDKPTIGGGYKIAAWYAPGRAGEEIGGDFYDVFETEVGKVGILIGDVSGKGIPAGALAAVTRSTLHAFAYDMSAAGEALTHANSVLGDQHGELDTFVTAFLAIMDPKSGAISYANAGHPAAMIFHADTGRIERLGSGQPPLIVVEKQDFEEYHAQLAPGDKLVLYTDGVSEAHHGPDMLGIEGVERVLAEHTDLSPEELADWIFETASERANGRIEDDVAMIIIERPPA